MFNKLVKNHGDKMYFLFRVIVGLLFAIHGAQKLFGIFGGEQQVLFGMMGVAGMIEFVGGLAIALGVFTRLAAIISGIQMLVAYFMVHVPQGWNPLVNKGEVALLYLAAFLALAAFGARKGSLEKALWKKER